MADRVVAAIVPLRITVLLEEGICTHSLLQAAMKDALNKLSLLVPIPPLWSSLFVLVAVSLRVRQDQSHSYGTNT